jgi:hypothetical protein
MDAQWGAVDHHICCSFNPFGEEAQRVRSRARWAKDVNYTSNRWRRTKRRARGRSRFRIFRQHDHVGGT